MSAYAYLRVSTDKQDVENQKKGILEYANKVGITKISFTEDSASGTIHWKKRELGKVIDNLEMNDTILFSEVSRIGRTVLQILEVVSVCREKKVSVYAVKENLSFDDTSLVGQVMPVFFGIVAQMERTLISMRTKEALEKRKADGIVLGRPKGKQAEKLKLDEYEKKIIEYLDAGINKRDIAKLTKCSHATLYNWLKRRQTKLNNLQFETLKRKQKTTRN